MINEESVTIEHQSSKHFCCVKCISWSAIFVGALVGIGLSFLLNLFGIAIGLSGFTTTQAGITTLAIGGFIGMLIGGIVSMFIAGWVAGYLGRSYCFNAHLGSLYGFSTWCLALIITVMLASHVSNFVFLRYHSLYNPGSIIGSMKSNIPTSMTTEEAKTTARIGTSMARMTGNKETNDNKFGESLFLIFIIFFSGAVASSFGGYFGFNLGKNCKTNEGNYATRRKC